MSRKKHPLKKYQTPLIMLALAVVMSWVAWNEYENSKLELLQQNKDKMILGWEEAKEIQSVRLERGAEIVEVVRQGDGWLITSPVNDLGNSFNINSWISDAGSEKGHIIEAKKGSNGNILWAEYGLDKTTKSLTLTKKDGSQAVLHFAEHNAFDGSYFLKYKDQVWVGEKPWVSVLTKNLKHLRERDIYRNELAPIAFSFEYQDKSKNFEIKLSEDDKWFFENKENWEASDKDILDWVQAMRKVSVVEFVDGLKAKEFRNYNQHRPIVKINMDFKDGKKVLWTVSKKKKKEDRERYYIRLNDSPTLMEADQAFVERFLGSRHYFRDGKPPFAIDIEKITEFTFSDKNHKKILLKKDADGKWSLAEKVKGYEFDSEQLENYLTRWGDLEAMVFLKKRDLKGVQKPSLKLSFRLKGRDKPLVFSFGDEFNSKDTFPRLNPLIYIDAGEKEGFGVQKSVFVDLGIEKLLKKDEIKQSSNEGNQN